MVKIRLSKVGKKGDITYRIVAIPGAKKTTGKNLEILGHWYPRRNEKVIDKVAIEKWVAKGAQVSPAVTKLLN